MDTSPDAIYNSISHSEWRVNQDGIQIFDLNDEQTQERRQNLP